VTDYEKTWEDFWADIVAPDGAVQMDQVKRELHDFYRIMSDLPKLYMEVTGGRVSKPNTRVDVVMDFYEENIARRIAQELRDLAEQVEP
jgi:hypothetical protein